MAKFYGNIGFIKTVETTPGVWEESIYERPYYGELLQNHRRWSSNQESTNSDLSITNKVSIVSDPYTNKNLHQIRYVEFMGAYWDVTYIDVEPPRIVLSVGGVYNGKTARTP